jgi:hypothetical protein
MTLHPAPSGTFEHQHDTDVDAWLRSRLNFGRTMRPVHARNAMKNAFGSPSIHYCHKEGSGMKRKDEITTVSTERDIADYLGVTVSCLRKWRARGCGPAYIGSDGLSVIRDPAFYGGWSNDRSQTRQRSLSNQQPMTWAYWLQLLKLSAQNLRG